MSTRWEREAAKGNEAAVKYRDEVVKSQADGYWNTQFTTVDPLPVDALTDFVERASRQQQADDYFAEAMKLFQQRLVSQHQAIVAQATEAASEERAPEAKALFQELLTAAPTMELQVCACGKIGPGGCFPSKATLDKRTKFVRIKGSRQAYLNKEDHKALQKYRESQGKWTPPHALSFELENNVEETSTYE